ncbi:UDP-N-acetylmuramoylalanine--D-glutamate ligase [Dyadobacter sp. CECT 9623]|uniref:UDP-N-acetylmuramoylalanine--D-glutamate ligase n=1 Tax=Dyadobacter linearis TaxID=2823330 RepID=A0ABN7RIH7_9BACT|nr:UDP-N-acetylmuramoyl-L-alanine--D-glutamate ligase [Dyadobacter sp. CECT 9623]CAG5074392.1 UDP-N-acetylmuramoylalanine--D-glutamate ligase [Dyadobacter sp. CECT 9623]
MQQKVVILGGGESGVGAAILAKSKGFEVFLSDKGKLHDRYIEILRKEDIAFEQEQHTTEKILDADLVVKSPGIPDTVPLIVALREKSVPIVSEIEFAAGYTNARIIAITGSNGKTTTTLLTYHLLKNAGLKIGLAGNIGDSFAWQVATQQHDFYVLEISSFQLDNILNFHPEITVLLNITPDHLDRYGYDFQNYINSKFNIIQNQTDEDYLIYFKESEVIQTELEKRNPQVRRVEISLNETTIEGAYLSDGKLISTIKGETFEEDFDTLPIKGPHNAINAMAAISVARLLNIDHLKICEGLRSFKNAPHRLEIVEVIDGVTYVNDSKATNVDSVFYALGSFNQPVILIAGGVDKGNDYAQIEELVRNKVKGLVVLGKGPEKLVKYFSGIVPVIFETENIQEAVEKASEWAVDQDVVLLSPACASFDLFKNYEDRGDQFKAAVRNLVH